LSCNDDLPDVESEIVAGHHPAHCVKAVAALASVALIIHAAVNDVFVDSLLSYIVPNGCLD
jgi:hypothetical protein